MKFEEIKVEFEKFNSLDVIASSPEVPTTPLVGPEEIWE